MPIALGSERSQHVRANLDAQTQMNQIRLMGQLQTLIILHLMILTLTLTSIVLLMVASKSAEDGARDAHNILTYADHFYQAEKWFIVAPHEGSTKIIMR